MRVPGGAGRGVEVDEAVPRRLRRRPTGPKPLPRARYSIRWADGRLAQYTSVRAYERDCLRGNYPLFQPGVGLTQEEDEDGALWPRGPRLAGRCRPNRRLRRGYFGIARGSGQRIRAR